jgi:endonuclease-3
MTLEERYKGVLDWFGANMQGAETELHHDDPFQLLVAVMLSAQCTDKRVNMVTPALFGRYPAPQAMAAASAEDIFQYIKSVSYPNSKARHLAAMARMLVADFGGAVPDDVEQLQRLPGVGRKTANVVGAVMFGREVMPVDTHVFRVSARIGLTRGARNPLQTERQLTARIPGPLLPVAHHWLILHGRYVCRAIKPRCPECGISHFCLHFNKQKTEIK